jgi:hypothetical protein
MADEAAQRPVDAAAFAAFVVKCGEAARSGNPAKLPAKGTTARLVGRKARGERVDDDAE